MHWCLRLPELITIICSEVDRDVEFGRQTLAVLARICKAFTTPALSLLWKHQSSFVPLLRCFPEDVVAHPVTDQRGKSVSARTMRLLRPLRPDDWTRPALYSRFITTMTLREADGVFGGLDDKTLADLHHSLAARRLYPPLLSNLRKLRYQSRAVRAAAYPFLALAQGGRLESLVYDNNGAAPYAPEFGLVRNIARASRNLNEFECRELAERMPPSQACLDTLLDSIRQLPNLQSVSLPCDYPLVQHLAVLPSLQYLCLEGQTHCPFSPPALTDDSHYDPVLRFKGLKHLALDFASLKQFNHLLSHVTFLECPLETLSMRLQHSDCPPDEQLRAVKQLVEKLPASNTLLSVSVCVRYTSEAIVISLGEFLDIIFRNHQLEVLEIVLPELLAQGLYYPQFGDLLVQRVATRWRGLRELTITPYFDTMEGTIHTEQTTLMALKTLAEHCPDLSLVQIAVNATQEVPNLDNNGHGGESASTAVYSTKHRQEIRLEFTEPSPIEKSDVQSVARFLTAVFYRVEMLDVEETSRWKETWDEVDELIQDAQFEEDGMEGCEFEHFG